MYKEIITTKSVEEIEEVLIKRANDYYFSDSELQSVEHKNTIKSLGARYLIKTSMLEFLGLKNEFKDIEIGNEKNGKPILIFNGEVRNRIRNREISNVQASISHSKNYITTLVVLE